MPIWHVPHFEKMLYDQAQLAVVLLEFFQIAGERIFADAARSILAYVRRDLDVADIGCLLLRGGCGQPAVGGRR